MASSIKHKGSEAKLYSAAMGVLVTTGALVKDSWYKISVRGGTSALPALAEGSVFKTPRNTTDNITLGTGDKVWPLTLTEICKVDVEISGEMGTIDTTDSCDAPYMTSLPDGFTNLSGSINTMLRFDEATDKIMPVSQTLMNKFFDIVLDDAEGIYTLTAQNDDDLLLMIFLNSQQTVTGMFENWMITPAILTSVSSPIGMKDVMKGDFSWSKGQGPASIYIREIIASA